MSLYPLSWLDSISAQDNSIASRQAKDSVLAVAAELDAFDYGDELPQVWTWRYLDQCMSTLTIEPEIGE